MPGIITLVLTIALVGLIVWVVTTYIPMPTPFRTIIIALVAILLVLWLVNYFGYADFPAPHHYRTR